MPFRRGDKGGANLAWADLSGDIDVRMVDLIAEDEIVTQGVLYRPRGGSSRVAVHLMHPRNDQSHNYLAIGLASAGYVVLARSGRAVNNDVNAVHEQLLVDFAAGVRYLRESVQADYVVLLGNSGGSSLAALYQWQARAAEGERFTETAAGDPFDLNGFALPAADAIVFVAGHVGEGKILLKNVDPSVTDESDLLSVDDSLDMYHPSNGFRPPPQVSKYDEEFVGRYRAAQVTRVQRIDAIARQIVADQRIGGSFSELATEGSDEQRALRRASRNGRYFLVNRTLADLAYTDLSIEPDDRVYGSLRSARPDLENYSEGGFSRYVTPRAWLSTWSGLSSRAATVESLSHVPDPLLVVHHAGDAVTRLSEIHQIVDASASDDRHLVVLPGLDHFGFTLSRDGERGDRSPAGVDAVTRWLAERFPTGS